MYNWNNLSNTYYPIQYPIHIASSNHDKSIKMKFLITSLLFSSATLSTAFVLPKANYQTPTQLQMAAVPPSDSATVGIVGRGFVSVLTAKLAAKAGYKTWMLNPPGQEETIRSLIDDDSLDLELIEATDSDRVDTKIAQTDAFIIAVDDDSTMDEAVINYILNPETATNVKRVVTMSRNLNGKDMGFLVKASKLSANREVWDNSNKDAYRKFEAVVKRQAAALTADYTIVRAGTLKGGGCGADEQVLDQYLSKKFYEMAKKDIVNWQLLFDCNVRGVKLTKGDVLPGPGVKAVFTSTGTDGGLPGDSSRCQIAEAMVQSLASEKAANVDFGVATEEAREPPSTDEWQKLFEATL